MSVGNFDHGPMATSQKRVTLSLLFAGTVLLLGAWLAVHFPLISKVSSIEEVVSPTYNLIVACLLPWFLQWTAVVCVILGFFRLRISREAALFAFFGSLTFAAIWWLGILFKYQGLSGAEVLFQWMFLEMEMKFGGGTFFDGFLFNTIGPILNPAQLRGPINLQGWNFLLTLLSTFWVVGYLLTVGLIFKLGKKSPITTLKDCVKFILLLLPFFLPPFIRLGILISQAG